MTGGGLDLAGMSAGQRQAALDRWAVLRPHIEDGVTLARAARDAGVPYRTTQRWLANYREVGSAGLVRQPRSDCGGRAIPDDLVTVIEGLALRTPKPTIAAVHR